jgi:hypothetical protein
MAKTRGGRKKESTNLDRRRRQWDAMSADRQRATKRPGSRKK